MLPTSGGVVVGTAGPHTALNEVSECFEEDSHGTS